MKKIIFYFLITLIVCSCETTEKKVQTIENISYSAKGRLSSGYADSANYHNDFFGFTFPIRHENWTIFNEEQVSNRMQDNKEELGWNDKEFEKTKNNIHSLLTLEKYYNTPQGKEQYINFMSEGLESISNVSNAIEYLNYTDSFILKNHSTTYPKYKTLSIDTGYIGSRKFLVQTLLIEDNPETKRYQKTYCAQYDKYLLNILVCYYTDKQLKENLELLNKISWE
jgi:hypothetical protein